MHEPRVSNKAPKVAYKPPQVERVEKLTGVLGKKMGTGPPKKMADRLDRDVT